MDSPAHSLWQNLHDATLVSLSLNWASGEARLELRAGLSSAARLLIEADGTALLQCPRRCPWGESVSINEVRGPINAPHAGMHLEIEMQSGDVLTLEAEAIRIRAI